jgi:hypothetical protein
MNPLKIYYFDRDKLYYPPNVHDYESRKAQYLKFEADVIFLVHYYDGMCWYSIVLNCTARDNIRFYTDKERVPCYSERKTDVVPCCIIAHKPRVKNIILNNYGFKLE